MLIHIHREMDKSWMSSRRDTTQYNDGCRAFIAFAISNCTAVDDKIYCPCRYCRNKQRHSPDYVLAHLTGCRGMTLGYNFWYMHGETTISRSVLGQCSRQVATDSAVGSTEQGGGTEQGRGPEQGEDKSAEAQNRGGDMHAKLCDAFGMYDVREAVSSQPHAVNEGTSRGDALKYYELLKTAEKPLHPSTKHSKLSATVHMYNLKCVGGISNKIFSDILELINQLLPPCDETLPVNTYKAKKFLSDMGLGYEKIPTYCNDCMLFWKYNKDLDSCVVCGESK